MKIFHGPSPTPPDVTRTLRFLRHATAWLFGASLAACAMFGGYGTGMQEVTHYQLSATRRTPKGIAVYDPHNELDLARLDTIADTVEACLARLPKVIPAADKIAQGCTNDYYPRSLNRSWFSFAAPPWKDAQTPAWQWMSCNATPTAAHQGFVCAVDPSVCASKPELKGCTGPCLCRAIVQGSYIVTAPNLEMAPGELTRLVTSCNDPWRGSGALTECAKALFPLTAPPLGVVQPPTASPSAAP